MADLYVMLNEPRFGEVVVSISTLNYIKYCPELLCLPILFGAQPNNKNIDYSSKHT